MVKQLDADILDLVEENDLEEEIGLADEFKEKVHKAMFETIEAKQAVRVTVAAPHTTEISGDRTTPIVDTSHPINSSALNMFRCGHVQDIMIGYDKHIYLQAKCLPEMRKDRIYKVVLCMDANVFDVVGAECGCPAGKGPCGSCKHIAAVCYALEEFSRLGKLPEFATCTNRLQAWNKPRQKKVPIIQC